MAFISLDKFLIAKSHEISGVADFYEIALEKAITSLNTNLIWMGVPPFS